MDGSRDVVAWMLKTLAVAAYSTDTQALNPEPKNPRTKTSNPKNEKRGKKSGRAQRNLVGVPLTSTNSSQLVQVMGRWSSYVGIYCLAECMILRLDACSLDSLMLQGKKVQT